MFIAAPNLDTQPYYGEIVRTLKELGAAVSQPALPDTHNYKDFQKYYNQMQNSEYIFYRKHLAKKWQDFGDADYQDLSDDIALERMREALQKTSQRMQFATQLQEWIEQLPKNVHIDSAARVDPKSLEIEMNRNSIPFVQHNTIAEWNAQNNPLPKVFKRTHSCQGNYVFFIENHHQANLLVQAALSQRESESDIETTKWFLNQIGSEFTLSEYIETPSEHYTHYRVFSAGTQILASALTYSAHTTQEHTLRSEGKTPWTDPKHPRYLASRKITSNKSAGGNQIPLDPNAQSRHISQLESQILADHNVINQALPPKLREQAQTLGTYFAANGNFIAGQDWLQDTNGNYHFLEANFEPGMGIFGEVYDKGNTNLLANLQLGAQYVAKAIHSELQNK